jgi:hypothetical protein
MKSCINFLWLAMLLATCALSAVASPITPSTISFDGVASKSGSGQTTSFTNLVSTDLNSAGTGSLASFLLGLDTSVAANFTFAGTTAGMGELLFTIKEGSELLKFYATSATIESSTKYFYTGYVIEDGQRMSATLLQTFTGAPDVYHAELTVTPEPNSLLLMGTGLLAVGGAMNRKRFALNA